MSVRKAKVSLLYKGIDITKDLEEYLSDFSYTDNEGKGDDIQIVLQDKDKKWQKPWLPGRGDTVTATIETFNWNGPGQEKLNCGKFYIDNVTFKGPPDAITIKAMSIPFKSSGKSAKHTRSWESASLATIASEVADSSELKLLYSAPNYTYDRVEQLKQTDLAFIKKLAGREGIAVKVTDDQLVLYEEKQYEGKGEVMSIERGEDDVLSYDFQENSVDEQYRSVTLTYFDPDKKENLKYSYTVPGVQEGAELKLNKRAKNLGEAMRWARVEARNRNKGAKTGKLSLMGNTNCMQGITVNIKNFGAFDGKYFVESSAHKIGSSGYTTDISIREVLGY